MLWKLIRIEVFKCPSQRNLICAAVGSGFQLVLMVLSKPSIILKSLGFNTIYSRSPRNVLSA